MAAYVIKLLANKVKCSACKGDEEVRYSLRNKSGDVRMYCVYCIKYRDKNGSESDKWYQEWKKEWK